MQRFVEKKFARRHVLPRSNVEKTGMQQLSHACQA
jgi:hypothetical protein